MYAAKIVAVAWLILVAASTSAQPSNPPDPVFPSDSTNPQQTGGRDLLEAVCPGEVVNGDEIECREGCPDFTSFGSIGDRFRWSLQAVTRGHFLSATSEDAVLWMTGCEPHSENFGGTALVTRRAERWTMLWYKAGVQTEKCHKVPLRNGREILICIATAGAQGISVTELYVEDLLDPKAVLMAAEASSFFAARDTVGSCGWNQEDEQKPYPLIRSRIEKVEFSSDKASGVSVITIAASYGKRTMNPEDVRACLANRDKVAPLTRRYRMRFVFNGYDYSPVPSSANSVRLFEDR